MPIAHLPRTHTTQTHTHTTHEASYTTVAALPSYPILLPHVLPMKYSSFSIHFSVVVSVPAVSPSLYHDRFRSPSRTQSAHIALLPCISDSSSSSFVTCALTWQGGGNASNNALWSMRSEQQHAADAYRGTALHHFGQEERKVNYINEWPSSLALLLIYVHSLCLHTFAHCATLLDSTE